MVSLEFPDSVASVEDAYRSAGSQKTLILIQDAHTNPSAQFNIAKSLDRILDKDQDFKLVFLEAADGSDSLSFLRKYGTESKRTQAAGSFVQKGIFNGAEYFDITSLKHILLWGVEDKALYLKSLDAYKAVAQQREKFLTYLSRVDQAVQSLKPRLFNPLLNEFDALHQKNLKEEISLTDYFTQLTKWSKSLKDLSSRVVNDK